MEFLPFHRPSIGEEEVRAVSEVLRSGWIGMGPRVREFEEAFAAYVGARHAVALSSGTAALHLALIAAGVGEGDEVLLPAMTFAATAEAVGYLRARPVFVDCEAETLNLDPADLERRITPRTRAVIPVHLGGRPCAMGAILELASRFGLRVVEDAAHALPASWGGRRVGSISDASCFSFYATKTLTTGEGGMVTTENGGWAGMLRRLRLHGIGEDAWARQKAAESWRYEVLGPGFKCNMNDIAAALGLAQLSRCDELHRSRENIARLYGEALGDVEEIALPSAGPQDRHAWHLYIIQLRLDRLSLSRDRFIAELGARGIGASVHFIPLHLHPRYRGDGGRPWEDLPSSTSAGERILSLPIYPAMTEADARRVAGAVLDIVRRFRR